MHARVGLPGAARAAYRQEPAGCILGTVTKDNPRGLGRVVRGDGDEFLGSVEEKDATTAQRCIREVNMSYDVFHPRHLLTALEHLDTHNAQGEYYLTDCPGAMIARGVAVRAIHVLAPCEALGVNTPEERATVEAVLRRRAREERVA